MAAPFFLGRVAARHNIESAQAFTSPKSTGSSLWDAVYWPFQGAG